MLKENKSGSSVVDGVIDFIAGSLGGFALVYVGQPLDTVKVKLQTFPHLYNGAWDCFKRTFRDEGIRRGLYAGTVPALIANIAENSVLFAAYGGCQKCVAYASDTKVEHLSTLGNATSGFLAAFFSSFSLCPTELIKVKLQAANEVAMSSRSPLARNTPYRLTKSIVKTEGIKGLFRGLLPTMGREMPGYFFFFGAYEGTRSLLAPCDGSKDDCGPGATMIAGAVGGVALWTLIFPFDVIKSRMQVNSKSGSFYQISLSIIEKEGVRALYNGLTPTLIRTVPATAILFLTYEYSKKLMHFLID